jgi:hypothetical protein
MTSWMGEPGTSRDWFAAANGKLYRLSGLSSGNRSTWRVSTETMIEPWRELLQYWRTKHIDGRPPSRDDLDPPLEIPQMAHNLLLIDVLPQGLEYRLVGTNFVKGAGLDMTGMMVGDSGKHAHVIGQWTRTLREASATGEARLLVGRFASHITASTVMLLLPLSASVDGIPKILGGLFVDGQYAPGTEIEALDQQPIIN